MKIDVRLFATLKDRAGANHIEVELPDPATVRDLRAAIRGAHPNLAETMAVSIVAVNRAFSDEETPILAHDEVALFPPVSGG
jgi:molybdopterin synthase catalytic subunit